jgi:hypothetical protein
MPIRLVRLKDGSAVIVNPQNPRECHTIKPGLFGYKIRCAATGATRRIPYRRVAHVGRVEL